MFNLKSLLKKKQKLFEKVKKKLLKNQVQEPRLQTKVLQKMRRKAEVIVGEEKRRHPRDCL